MQLTRAQRELQARRIGDAVTRLNNALSDAYRFGLRGRVVVTGNGDHPVVNVELMRPVESSGGVVPGSRRSDNKEPKA